MIADKSAVKTDAVDSFTLHAVSPGIQPASIDTRLRHHLNTRTVRARVIARASLTVCSLCEAGPTAIQFPKLSDGTVGRCSPIGTATGEHKQHFVLLIPEVVCLHDTYFCRSPAGRVLFQRQQPSQRQVSAGED